MSDLETKRPKTPGLSLQLAGLFATIEYPIEMSLFYRDVKRAGLELAPEDHARMWRSPINDD